MRKIILLLLLVLPGVLVMAICAYFLRIDWAALQQAHAQFSTAVSQNAELRELFITKAGEDIHRLNVFAEGVWFLLGGIISAIGIHGLVVYSDKRS